MAGLIQQVYINSQRFGFQDVTIEGETAEQFGGVPFTITKGAFAGINWEIADEAQDVQGNRKQSIGVSGGYGTAKSDFELLVAEADDWAKTVTLSGQFPLTSVFFNYRITHAVNNGVLGQDVRVVEVIGLKILNISAGNQRGNDAATQRYQCRAGMVKVNGIQMFGDPTQ